MKNLSLVLSLLSLIAVIALGGMYMSDKSKAAAAGAVPVVKSGGANLAYVDIDTLEAKYEFLKMNREEFKKKQMKVENELQRSYGQMQNDASEVQKKAQAGTLTQSEYEAAQRRLMQMQQTLESHKQSLTDQLIKENEDLNYSLKRKLDSFLSDYNKSHNYDYILSFSGSGSSILYANQAHNITNDVVNGMNAWTKKEENKK